MRCQLYRVIFFVLILFASGRAIACSCGHPTTSDVASVKEGADAVFVGEVKKVSILSRNGIEEVRATFKIVKLEKGPRTPLITIVVYHGGTSCDLMRAAFKLGERYLISGSKVRWDSESSRVAAGVSATESFYYNNFCDLREKLN